MTRPFITNRHGNWKVVEAKQTRQASAPPLAPGQEVNAEPDGLRAVRNHDLDRLQLRFDAIPPATVREQRKASGWNWSPTHEAWQRKVTANVEYALARHLDGQAMPEASHEPELAR